MIMKQFPLFLLAAATAASTAFAAGDFFGAPEKIVVPKPAAATPAPATPAPATPAPAAGPTLMPDETDPLFLKTPTAGGNTEAGTAFRDLGPDHGILIGFEYSTSVNDTGATVIQTLQPIYVRPAGKARGTLHGKSKPGNPATMLESRPGFAVAAIDARGSTCLEGFKITFMRYENGKLDPSEKYTSKWCGGDGGDRPLKHLATDTRPIYGLYGRSGGEINEIGFLVRKEPPVPKETSVAMKNPFGSPTLPGSEPAENGSDKLEGGGPLEPATFDSAYQQTPLLAGAKKGWGSAGHDVAPMGAVLIGFDFTTGASEKGDPAIKSVKPLYLLPNGSKQLGTLLGTAADGPVTRAAAREGYAISAIDGRGVGVLSGFQLTFSRLKGTALETSDTYQSDWYGSTEGQFTRASGGGRTVVGVTGKFGKDVNALALLVRKETPSGLANMTTPSPRPPVPESSGTSTPAPATPAPAIANGVEIFACADDEYTLFLNGREILSGQSPKDVQTTIVPLVKGDVLAAVVKDTGGESPWFSLRVVRAGKTVLDAGDMRYLTTETLNWKTSKLVSNFKEPKVWTHEKKLGTDSRPRAAWAGPKDANATTLYFKGVMP
jgi:hypothetical protein